MHNTPHYEQSTQQGCPYYKPWTYRNPLFLPQSPQFTLEFKPIYQVFFFFKNKIKSSEQTVLKINDYVFKISLSNFIVNNNQEDDNKL